MPQLLKLLEGHATEEKVLSSITRKASHDACKEADTGANNFTTQEMIKQSQAPRKHRRYRPERVFVRGADCAGD